MHYTRTQLENCSQFTKNVLGQKISYVSFFFLLLSIFVQFINNQYQYLKNSNSCDAAQPESTINDQNGISSHPNGYEKTAPVSAELKTENGYRKSPEHDVHADDFTEYSKEVSKDSVAASGVHAENLLADSVIYTDKNILESDLPELIVCYQDSTFHDVKDICVDEGMPAEDKCLTDNLVSGNSTLPSKNFRHTDLTEEADTDISYEEDFKSSPYKDFRENDSAEGVDKGEDNLDKDTAYNGDSFQQKSSPESNKDQNSASFLMSQIQTDKEEFTAVDKTDEIACNTPTSPIQTGELECNAIDKTTEIVRDSTLSSEDLCGETSLESLLKSAKGGEDKSSQQSDEVSISCILCLPDCISFPVFIFLLHVWTIHFQQNLLGVLFQSSGTKFKEVKVC